MHNPIALQLIDTIALFIGEIPDPINRRAVANTLKELQVLLNQDETAKRTVDFRFPVGARVTHRDQEWKSLGVVVEQRNSQALGLIYSVARIGDSGEALLSTLAQEALIPASQLSHISD